VAATRRHDHIVHDRVDTGIMLPPTARPRIARTRDP
jgi:hypothetical protein